MKILPQKHLVLSSSSHHHHHRCIHCTVAIVAVLRVLLRLLIAPLQNKAEFIDRCFDTLIQSAREPVEGRGPYTSFSEKMIATLK